MFVFCLLRKGWCLARHLSGILADVGPEEVLKHMVESSKGLVG